jgi:hypothetical protein
VFDEDSTMEGPARKRQLHEIANKDIAIKDNLEHQMQAVDQTRDAQVRKAHADARVKRAGAAHARAMSEHFGSQAETARQSAIRLASMDPAELASAGAIFDDVKKNPALLQNNPWIIEQARKIAPDEVDDMLVAQGQQHPEYQKRVKEGNRNFPGMVEDLQKKQTEEANTARTQEFKADQELAGTLEKTIMPAFERLLKLIAEKMDAMTKDYNGKLMIYNLN